MRFNLSDEKEIRALLQRHEFSFSKALGQNFLIDPSVCPAMAQTAVCDGADCVLEIGPGAGVLTASLCEHAERVAAVELDRRLFPVLRETLADYENFTLVEGDAMRLDLKALLREQFGDGARVAVCANLPYYITSPLLMRMLESRLPVEKLVVMVQKEAAERLAAEIGSRAAGAVTVAVRYYTEPRVCFEVPRTSFLPAPKVDSAVLELRVRKTPPVKLFDEAFFFRMVRAAFGQRRKTAVNALSAGLGLEKKAVAAAIAGLGLPEAVRAEAMSMETLAALADRLFAAKQTQ